MKGIQSKKSPLIRDRVVELIRVRASDLAPDPRNWRRHPEPQRAALRGVLREIGFAGALLARRDGDGRLVLIDGHLRRDVAPDMEVPVLVLDLDEAEAGKLLLTFDPLGAMAQADKDALLALLQSATFEDAAVNALLEAVANDERQPMPDLSQGGLTDPDEVPPAATDSYVRLGDIWQCGKHRIMCGDSTKAEDVRRLLGGVVSQLMLTDPPYGVGYETDGANPRWRHDNRPIANDDLGKDQGAFWLAAFSAWPLDGDCYVFSPPGPPIAALASAVIASGIEHHQWLIWVKDRFSLGRSHYHYRHEHIFYGWKGHSSWQGRRDEDSIWECPRPSRSPEHPTMKPVAICEKAIKNSSKGGASIADPFLGSGTTVIACEKLGRICYGMEIDPHYVQVTIERWQNFTGRKAVKVS